MHARIALALVVTAHAAVAAAAAAGSAGPPALRDGDIIFQDSQSSQSRAIERATHSRWSHMGMIVHRKGAPYVYEASATVRYTPLDAWIARGEGGRYVVKRLRPQVARVTPQDMQRAAPLLRKFDGKDYDLAFGWSDERMYCSELVWKIYERALGVKIGALQTMRTLDLSDPIVRAKLRERYGKRIPLDEPVITPAAMFESPALEVVARR